MALRFASVLLFTLAVGLGVAIPAPPPTGQCGLNAERRTCGTACVPTCQNPHPGPICVLPCVDGCFCKDGYLKSANGNCVRPEECEHVPKLPFQMPEFMAEEPKKEEPKCGENEEHRPCGPSCHPTCAMPLPKPWCSLRCFTGCYCKEGYLRNEQGKCVHASECKLPDGAGPIHIPLQRITVKPHVLVEGAGPVNIPLQRVTLKPHDSGVVHVPLEKEPQREQTGPVHIPLEKQPFVPRCPHEDEEFHACGVQLDCLNSCKIPTTPKCMERKCTPGCVCRKPLVRHEDGRCVEQTQCPKTNPFAQA